MNDRELLERAARAAGYDVVWNEHWQAFQWRTPQLDKFGHARHVWVPYDDDGDALRLTVACGMLVDVDYGIGRVDVLWRGCGTSCIRERDSCRVISTPHARRSA